MTRWRRTPAGAAAATRIASLLVLAAGCTSHSTGATPAGAHHTLSAASYPAPAPTIPSTPSPGAIVASGPAATSLGPPAPTLSVGSTPNAYTTSAPGPPTTVRATPGGPVLTLSASSGTLGTVVAVTAGDCPAGDGTYRGFFADAKALAQPNDPQLRHPLTISSSSPQSATARYTISADDATGTGIFEVQCQGNANATAPFTVEP